MFAAGIAAAAFRARALTRGGAIAAFVVGTVTYGSGGWAFTLLLLAFFIPSVGLSRAGRTRKQALVDTGKAGPRDAWQVVANGGIATLCAALAGVARATGVRAGDPARWAAAFAGSYAAATADTWGTEIGLLARGKPHSILTFRPIPTGLSGGVTWVGSAAEAAGAAWIAGAAALCLKRNRTFFVPVFLAGAAGALTDSILGATLQELRRCPACDRSCETNPHVCGTPTLHVRGLRGFSNDAVNLAATLSGALVAFALVRRRP